MQCATQHRLATEACVPCSQPMVSSSLHAATGPPCTTRGLSSPVKGAERGQRASTRCVTPALSAERRQLHLHTAPTHSMSRAGVVTPQSQTWTAARPHAALDPIKLAWCHGNYVDPSGHLKTPWTCP